MSYSEVDLKKDKALEDIFPEVGSRAEIYSEEHEKLLGSTEKSWALFVDGYGKDGKRIYDPVRGKTCHQCRSGCCLCCLVESEYKYKSWTNSLAGKVLINKRCKDRIPLLVLFFHEYALILFVKESKSYYESKDVSYSIERKK